MKSRIAAHPRARLEADLPGVKLEDIDVVGLMDICLSRQCLQSDDAARAISILPLHPDRMEPIYLPQSLAEYYGYGAGNPLGRPRVSVS